MRTLPLVLVLLAALASASVHGAETTKPAPRGGSSASGSSSGSSSELANLKSYEERRYRIDMLDCAKEKGADRRVCERLVHRDAARKSRRRGAR